MTIQELINRLEAMPPTGQVVVRLIKEDGTDTVFDIQGVRDDRGNAQLEIYTIEEV
jgi:hypothetical protein